MVLILILHHLTLYLTSFFEKIPKIGNFQMAMQKAKEMEETIKEEFHATILSNSWLSEHMKKALILKANMMRLRSGYENIHVKEEEMETFYKNLDWKEDSEKMTFLMMEDIFVTIAKNAEFEYLNDTTNRGDDYYESLIGRMHGAFYAREYNMIDVPTLFNVDTA
ncbi:hypothetical protein Y032_0316g2294 [Ancylostoma ceylanicum]|uniref:Peptidase M13 N-terminal domain-containing protein n=3 Tax=Ancylostoma ceylanicum TaxID=53326 RepID=A0A016S1C7_9BILA|nr:hypothetical protein Y032_0316g2294 [Ancylostoma ceylanicum]